MEGVLPLALALGVLTGMVMMVSHISQIVDAIERVHYKWRHRGSGPVPDGRPLEAVAADARRLRRQYALVPTGAPMVRRNGALLAYDYVLVEAARCLGVEHELSELPLGPSRDLERLRLEAGLEDSGLRLTG